MNLENMLERRNAFRRYLIIIPGPAATLGNRIAGHFFDVPFGLQFFKGLLAGSERPIPAYIGFDLFPYSHTVGVALELINRHQDDFFCPG